MTEDTNFMPVDKRTGMEILIVEDQIPVAEIVSIVIRRVFERFPGCKVRYVRFLSEALEIINRHAPDVVVLDLLLADPDSSMEKTLSHLDEIEERSPLVILTGHDPAEVRKLIPDSKVEIVAKDSMIEGRDWFFNLLLNVRQKWLDKRQKEEREAVKSILGQMREISKQLNAPDQRQGAA